MTQVASVPALTALAAIRQLPALQKKPDRQSESAEQLFLQMVPEQMSSFGHCIAIGNTHDPPLQLPGPT
jgi:hypothetical protein